MNVKLNFSLTKAQYAGVEKFANRHNTTVFQLLRDLACDIAGIDASAIKPRKSKYIYNPVRMPSLEGQNLEEVVSDYARRGFSKDYIAARTKMPWRHIETIMKANSYVKPPEV